MAQGGERLQPEATGNPVLHRIIDFLVARAVEGADAVVPLPDEDTMVVGVLRPHPELHPGLNDRLALLKDLFPMQTPKVRSHSFPSYFLLPGL